MPTVAGREAELAVLGDVLDGLRAGRGHALLVEGEAGIGKSALVKTALARARSHGFRVVTGACDELMQQFPLAPVTYSLGLRIGGQTQDLGDPVLAAAEDLLGQVQGWCAKEPVVLVLEDLHWADEASLLWWRRLCRLTVQLPLVLAGTRRLVPRRPAADALARQVRAVGGVVLPLKGLGPDAVRAMTADLAGAVPGPELLRWLEHAGGSPFYVRELVEEAIREGALRTVGGVADLAPGAAAGPGGDGPLDGPSPLLRAAVESRLDFLSEDVLRIAALLCPSFRVTELAAVFEQTSAELLPALEDAIMSGVLEDAGVSLRFRHSLLRQALYDGIPVPVRAALHRQAAQALAKLDANPDRVARQLLALPPAEPATGWEVSWLADNSQELVRRVPTVAAELLERTLRETWPDDAKRARLEDRLLDALFVLGHYAQTERLARDWLPWVADPDRRGQLTWLLGYALTMQGRHRAAQAALASVGPGLSPLWQARLAALQAIVIRFTGPRSEAWDAARTALAAGRNVGDATTTAYALHAVAVQHFEDGDLVTSCGLNDEARALAERDSRLGDLWVMMTYNRVGMAAELGEYEDALKLARQALARGELVGSFRLRRLHGLTAAVAYEVGRWDEALAELDAGVDDDGSEADGGAEAPCVRVLISAHRDEWDAADGCLAAIRRSTGDYAPSALARLVYPGPFTAVAVLDLERSGRPGRVARLLEAWLDPHERVWLTRFGYRVLPSLARLALVSGHRAGAGRVADAAREEADRDPLNHKQALAQWCRGLANGESAQVLTAAETLRECGLPLLTGAALEDAAVLLAEAGQAAPARAALGDALQVYGQIGAAWDARRAASRIRPFGIRPGVRGPRRRPRTGWEALTAMEQQVAGLVAAGRSNPDIAGQLFISRRTVESHVSRILAKLQVPSRWEVRTFAEEAAVRF